MKKVNIKNIALSLLAVILVLVTTVGVTYSWIDDVKMVQFENDDLSDGAPLKTGVDINASVNITSEENTINLGNILSGSDITYDYQEDGETKKHIRYDTAVANASKNPRWNRSGNQDGINEKKGYFYESGGMHLSPCLSDGDTFYFPVGSNTYREGNKDDENVNYISFTAKVSSPDANVDFWFKQLPTITGKNASGGTVNVSNYARYAIIVDGQTHVYSSTGSARTGTSTLSGNIPVGGVRKTAEYTYGNAANTNGRGANGNTLFSIKKGATVKMTIKIWLESGFDSSVTTSDINLQLVSSWAYSRRIWINDKTTGGAGESWLNDDSAKLYVTFPEALAAQESSPANWPNVTNGPFYNRDSSSESQNKLKYDSTEKKYYFDIPLVYNNQKMILYRCNSTYWNSSQSNTAQRSEYNVYCWNWWQTIAPDTYQNETYTLYGGSLDSTAKGYFGDDMGDISQANYGNKGYGTWGDVEQISVYSHYGETDYALKGDGKALYIMDYSDEDTSGEKYIYEMSRADNGTSTPWKAYVPKSSSKIKFRYFGSGDNTVAWGYSSWNNQNPQRRPLQSSGLYASNSTVYHFCRHFGGDKGWGYWNGADTVYLIKTGFLNNESTLKAHLFDKGDVYLKINSEWAENSPRIAAYFWNGSSNYEVTMTKVGDNTYVAPTPSGTWANVLFKRYNSSNGALWNQTVDLTYNEGQQYTITGKDGEKYTGSWSEYKKSDWPGESLSAFNYVSGDNAGTAVKKHYAGGDRPVYKSGAQNNIGVIRVYNRIIFNNGSSSNQTKTLILFPGCFYEPGANSSDNGKWYGALDENGRDASSSSGNSGGGGGGGGSGTDTGGGSMPSSYNDSSAGFVFTVDGQQKIAYANSSGEFKVRLNGLTAGTHSVTVKRNSTSFKNGKNVGYATYYAVPSQTIYLSISDSDHTNDFAIHTFNSGTNNYIVTFQYDNGNTGTIKITSILKEG